MIGIIPAAAEAAHIKPPAGLRLEPLATGVMQLNLIDRGQQRVGLVLMSPQLAHRV